MNESDKLNLDKKRYRLEKITFVAAAIYAALTAGVLITSILMVRAGNQQAKATEIALHYSQRSFVYCKQVTVAAGGPVEKGGEKGPYAVVVQLGNSGPTQARDVIVQSMGSYMLAVPTLELPANYTYPSNRPDTKLGLITPNSENGFIYTLADSDADQMRLGQKSLVVYGNIHYCDVFHKPHVTKFCQQFHVYHRHVDTGNTSYDFGPCPLHNCDDEDCGDFDENQEGAYCEKK